MQSFWIEKYKEKIILPENLQAKVAELRKLNKTIATLNGSFDLMHSGHLHIIYEASKIADVLIVAVNTDKSIQKYKSPARPIITLEHRLQMMAAIEFINYLTWFDETDPCKILSIIKPDFHINGIEYGENCIEAETVIRYGGKIVLVDRIPGLSTSEIITKIKTLCD